jgi:hypothetical protein
VMCHMHLGVTFHDMPQASSCVTHRDRFVLATGAGAGDASQTTTIACLSLV